MKRRKIYYVPGMITLVFLPILCYYYLKPFNKTERVLEVVFPDKYKPNSNYENGFRFDTTLLSLPENKRKYLDIHLGKQTKINKIKLDSFYKKMQILIKTKDTINGLHLVFDNGFKYGDFIKAINTCITDTFPHFLVYENNLWYLYKNIDVEKRDRVLKRIKDRKLENQNRIIENELKMSKISLIDKIIELNKIWPFYIIFLILIILSIMSIKKIKNG